MLDCQLNSISCLSWKERGERKLVVVVVVVVVYLYLGSVRRQRNRDTWLIIIVVVMIMIIFGNSSAGARCRWFDRVDKELFELSATDNT